MRLLRCHGRVKMWRGGPVAPLAPWLLTSLSALGKPVIHIADFEILGFSFAFFLYIYIPIVLARPKWNESRTSDYNRIFVASEREYDVRYLPHIVGDADCLH